MRHVTFIAFLLLFSVWLVSPVWAQDPIVYPAKGQSEDQMEKDKYQCYSWAKNQTGFDPMKTPTTTSAPPAKEKEVWGAGKTGVAGGATGAIVGGAARGKKGAVRGGLIGAAGGALIGGARSSNQRNREAQKRKDWERKETNNYVRARSEYNRAFGACMEGRGYSVK
jgi:outer membrane lipoprotein SlyB